MFRVTQAVQTWRKHRWASAADAANCGRGIHAGFVASYAPVLTSSCCRSEQKGRARQRTGSHLSSGARHHTAKKLMEHDGQPWIWIGIGIGIWICIGSRRRRIHRRLGTGASSAARVPGAPDVPAGACVAPPSPAGRPYTRGSTREPP